MKNFLFKEAFTFNFYREQKSLMELSCVIFSQTQELQINEEKNNFSR